MLKRKSRARQNTDGGRGGGPCVGVAACDRCVCAECVCVCAWGSERRGVGARTGLPGTEADVLECERMGSQELVV